MLTQRRQVRVSAHICQEHQLSTPAIRSRECSRKAASNRGRKSARHAAITTDAPTSVVPSAEFLAKVPVVVVGAGPAGLVTALALEKRGFKDIKVLEKRPEVVTQQFRRSYHYLIDARSHEMLSHVGLFSNVVERGLPNKGGEMTVVNPSGGIKKNPLPAFPGTTSVWIPRPTFLDILEEAVQQNENIQLHMGMSVTSMTISDPTPQTSTTSTTVPQPRITVTASNRQGESQTYNACLVVGCDGIHSAVRKSLQKMNASKFAMHELDCPSAGLRFKVLPLPPNPVLKAEHGTTVLPNPQIVKIFGKDTTPDKALALGLLPIKDPNSPRTANVILKPDHHFWTLKDGKELGEFLQESFPQLDIASLYTPEQLEEFASDEGGQFPKPQYCTDFTHVIEGDAADADSSATLTNGVVLLGDAMKCFPPDLGQGVNSALQDVSVLLEALEEHNNQLGPALAAFQARRAPDVAALVELQTFCYPWQYGQDALGRNMWSVNFGLRLLLNKMVPQLFSPPSFMMIVQYTDKPYREIVRLAHETTRNMVILFAAVVLALSKVNNLW